MRSYNLGAVNLDEGAPRGQAVRASVCSGSVRSPGSAADRGTPSLLYHIDKTHIRYTTHTTFAFVQHILDTRNIQSQQL